MIGSRVYIPDINECWVPAVQQLGTLHDNNVLVVDKDGREQLLHLSKLKLASLPLQSSVIPEKGFDDLTSLEYFHAASILENFKRRHIHQKAYSRLGRIFIFVNPFEWLPIYDLESRALYSGAVDVALPPHVYGISLLAFSQMKSNMRNQTIVISGDSGSGKTESTKLLMHHLSFLSEKLATDDSVDAFLFAKHALLDSFGNAKTARNDNSSRCGKLSQMLFDVSRPTTAPVFVGTRCTTYLLERSRIVYQATSMERNFHVIYQLLAAPEDFKRQVRLQGKDALSFAFTNHGDVHTHEIDRKTDAQRFEKTLQSLQALRCPENVLRMLWQALAGLLYAGEVVFASSSGSSNHNSSGGGGSNSHNGNESLPAGVNVTVDKDGLRREAFEALVHLLGLEESSFVSALCTRTVQLEAESVKIAIGLAQAIANRDSMVREIYKRVVRWVVGVINFRCSELVRPLPKEHLRMISILEMAGFENLSINHLDQLCLNYANEKLYQRLWSDARDDVMHQFEEEGLVVAQEFMEKNESELQTMSLLEGKLSIFLTLNEECLIPKGADPTFLSKVKQMFHNKNPQFQYSPLHQDKFTISHYAGKVTYTATGFLERNRDSCSGELRKVLASSKNPLISALFLEDPKNLFASDGSVGIDSDLGHLVDWTEDALLLNFDETAVIAKPVIVEQAVAPPDEAVAKGSASALGHSQSEEVHSENKRLTLTWSKSHILPAGEDGRKARNRINTTYVSRFRNQLQLLLDDLNTSEVHHLLCLKPNVERSPSDFSSRVLLDQLQVSGLTEVLQQCRKPYDNRMYYTRFVRRFQDFRDHSSYPEELAAPSQEENDYARLICEQILNSLQEFCAKTPESPSKLTFFFGPSRVHFDNVVLTQLERRRNIQICNFAVLIQKYFRLFLHCRDFKAMKVSAVLLQKHIRRRVYQTRYEKSIALVFKVQRLVRGWHARRRARELRKEKFSHVLQPFLRMATARRKYLRIRSAILSLQNLFRTRRQRKVFVSMRDIVRAEIARVHKLHEAERRRQMRDRIQVQENKLQDVKQARQREAESQAAEKAAREARLARDRELKVQREQEAEERRIQNLLEEQELQRQHVERQKQKILIYERTLLEHHQKVVVEDREDGDQEEEGELKNASSADTEDGKKHPPLRSPSSEARRAVLQPAQHFTFDDEDDIDEIVLPVPRIANFGPLAPIVRNRHSDLRVKKLHRACEFGDLEVVSNSLKDYPGDRYVLDRTAGFCSVYHSAVRGNQVAVLRLLGLTGEEVVRRIGSGKINLIHYAAINQSSLELLEYLVEIAALQVGERKKKTPYPGKDVIQVSWMLKETSRKTYQKRWVSMTMTQLRYSTAPTEDAIDVFPLDPAFTSITTEKDHNGYVITLVLLEGKKSLMKSRSSLVLRTFDESEFFDWMRSLTVTTCGRLPVPVKYYPFDKEAGVLSLRTAKGDTALHLLIENASLRFDMAKSTMSFEDEQDDALNAVGCAVWLVSMGCEVNSRNRAGTTPLHLAAKHANTDMILCLLKLGASTSCADVRRRTPLQTCAKGVKAFFEKHGDVVVRHPRPLVIKGFTYLCIHFKTQHSIISNNEKDVGKGIRKVGFDDIEDPTFGISVYNARNQKIEAESEEVHPLSIEPHQIWWGYTWQMKIPMDAIETGSKVILQLRSNRGNGNVSNIAWTSYTIVIPKRNSTSILEPDQVVLPLFIGAQDAGPKKDSKPVANGTVIKATIFYGQLSSAHPGEFDSPVHILNRALSQHFSVVNPVSKAAEKPITLTSNPKDHSKAAIPVLPRDEKGRVVLNTLEYHEGVHTPACFIITIPPRCGPGTLMTKLGGRPDRNVRLPEGVHPGDEVVIVAIA